MSNIYLSLQPSKQNLPLSYSEGLNHYISPFLSLPIQGILQRFLIIIVMAISNEAIANMPFDDTFVSMLKGNLNPILNSPTCDEALVDPCPSPTATQTITTGQMGGSYTTVSTNPAHIVTHIVGNVSYGSASFAHTVTIGVGTTWVITAGSHLACHNLNVVGTLIIQEGASVSVGATYPPAGGGSLSVNGQVIMCSNTGIENCGTTTFSSSPAISYVGTSSAKAVARFSNYPGYWSSLTMPYGSGLTTSSNVVLATPVPGLNGLGGFTPPVGSAGAATLCTIGSCSNLPFTVSSSCGTFYNQTAVPACNAGASAPTLPTNTISNICPATTANLSAITASNLPANTALTWHTASPASNANKMASITAVPPGTYYAAIFDSANNCYGTATTAVTVNTVVCCNAGNLAPIITKN